MPPLLSAVFFLCCSSNDTTTNFNGTNIVSGTTLPASSNDSINLPTNATVIQFANAVGNKQPVIETRIPSWIAAPQVHKDKLNSFLETRNENATGSPETVAPNINININFPFNGAFVNQNNDSKDSTINSTVSSASNILQINIFNQGAPILRPTIITKVMKN